MFDSGVMVVQLQSHSEEEMIASAMDNVSLKKKHFIGINVLFSDLFSVLFSVPTNRLLIKAH